MSQKHKHIFTAGIGLIMIIGVFFGLYVLYLESHYTRIPDNLKLANTAAGQRAAQLSVNTPYTASTYNIGFGAYTPDVTFFMDTGRMNDGTATAGSASRAASEETVRLNTGGAITTIAQANKGTAPDFMLWQEVDTGSDRSYFVNQRDLLTSAFSDDACYMASNFHTGFLLYPLLQPHGRVQSGIVLQSSLQAESVVRRSYPVDASWPTKYFDLDRCFIVASYPVDTGKRLILINSHMSAYDAGGVYKQKQLALLLSIMRQAADAGNYVIAGGDWNQALSDSIRLYPSEQETPSWVGQLSQSDLPEGFSVVTPDNLSEVASCRSTDIPYQAGVSYRVTVDGFIVSSNVEAHAHTIDTGFAYSDHNPVLLSFTLKG